MDDPAGLAVEPLFDVERSAFAALPGPLADDDDAARVLARDPPDDEDDDFAATVCVARARLAPERYGAGSTGVPFTRVSKCTCGPVQLPVQPT